MGHEIDITISDMVADLRAPTPTAAAELVVPRRADLETELLDIVRRLRHALETRVRTARAELNTLAVRAGPERLIGHVRQLVQRTDDLGTRLGVALRGMVKHLRARLDGAGGKLDSLSPLRVLERGYAIARSGDIVLRDAEDVRVGDVINTILFRGRLTSRVESVEKHDAAKEEEDQT